MNVEAVYAVHTLEFFEPVERNLAGSRDELKQLRTFLFVKRPDCTPEPLDLLRRGVVIVIFRIGLPVIDINVGETRNEKLKLLFIKDRDELCWDNLMEAWSKN